MIKEVQALPKKAQTKVSGLVKQIVVMQERTRRVIRQAQARIFDRDTKHPDKLASVFEPHTEINRKGKASKPTEFGTMVKIQEAENQIVTHYEAFKSRPSDSDLLVESMAKHAELLGRTPQLVAADAGFYSQANDQALEDMGVQHTSIPNLDTKSDARRKHQKQRVV